jgi:predicted ATPase/class 3 adenylate cyclase
MNDPPNSQAALLSSLAVPGHRVLARCWEDARTITFAGQDSRTSAPVFIKILKSQRSSAAEVDALRRDYEWARRIEVSGVLPAVAHGFANGVGFLVVTDDGSRPLGELLLARQLPLAGALQVVIRLASILHDFHRTQHVHGNLNLQTIWFNAQSGETRVTGLSSVISLNDERNESHTLNGDLHFVAPEQTGRVDRAVDPRTDLYAVGIVLHHLLCGRLPFDESNSIELIHAHLARAPRPLHEIAPELPRILSDIVARLLAKSPEDRYQTARGLEHDLTQCLAQVQQRGTIADFDLGSRDSTVALSISTKLYGRERERQELRAALERATKGSVELVLISGSAGIGKSRLARSTEHEARSCGTFVAAKFDQFRQNEPYSFIVQAFRVLLDQLLASGEASIQAWRERLAAAVGPNADVVSGVVPEFGLLLGLRSAEPASAAEQLPAAEERNRFNHVFRRLLRVFAREKHTFSIFLDDLQWADPASLGLLRALIGDPRASYLLVIGACRDEGPGVGEVARMIEDIRAKRDVTRLDLGRLAPTDVGVLIDDTLHCGPERATDLARLLWHKTDGNPFFINQLLRFLHHEQLITFDYEEARWQWDLRQIAAQGVTEDVLDLMSRKLLTLPAPAQDVLKAAACLGGRFDLGDLALVMQKRDQQVRDAIQAAAAQGLVVSADDAGAEAPERQFQFLHDRVQQAAYALISEQDRREVRLRIGRRLLAGLAAEDHGNVPFVVIDNLNAGADLVSSATEREEIAKLNLAAGRRARDLAAFDAALGYFRSGIKLLAADSWGQQYGLAFDLRIECFECAYVTGHTKEANDIFVEVLANARTVRDKARAYYLKIISDSSLDRSDEAVAMGLEALRLFGEALPATPSKIQLLYQLFKVIYRLRGRKADELLRLPAMVDEDRKAALGLLMSICPAAYFRNPDLMSLAALRIMQLSLQFGIGSASSFGCVLYGLVRGGVFGDYKGGCEFGRLAVDLAMRDGTPIQRGKIMMIHAGFVRFWREPIDASIEMLRTSLRVALDSGDVQYAHYSMLQIIFLGLARGTPLDEIRTECTRHQQLIEQTTDWFATASNGIRRQYVLALQGETRHGSSLSSADYDEDVAAASFRAAGNLTAYTYYLIVKIQLTYLFGEHRAAEQLWQETEANIQSVINQIVLVEHYFYGGLAALALARQGGGRPARRMLRQCRKKLAGWAVHCPENFEVHRLLLEAEFASFEGRIEHSEQHYDRAIETAQHGRFQHLEALANELAGGAYLRRGLRRVAMAYLAEARKCYAEWGALAKVRQLGEIHPDLASGDAAPPAPSTARPPSGMAYLRELSDFDMAMRATTGISAEMRSARLLDKLMRLVLEAVLCDRGIFLTEDRDTLFIEAAGSSDAGGIRVGRTAYTEDSLEFSERMVRYVLRTGHRIVVDDRHVDARFASCPYLVQRRPRSVACVPILRKGEVLGAIYVENSLAHGAFMPDRIQQLALLANQVGAIIENTNLQRDLSEHSSHLREALQKVELLEHIRSHLTKFVPKMLQERIEANPEKPDIETRNVDVSILFLDMAGYTSLSEKLDAEKLQGVVETYFSRFLDDILLNGGDINEVAGDGLMIIFQHEDPRQHARNATATALTIRDRTNALNREAHGIRPEVVINIGIHSGEALFGANKIESEMGPRWVFTATGYTANLAARIGASAKEGVILVSDETAARLGNAFEVRPRGPQAFKGISRPIEVYSVESMISAAEMQDER